MTQKVSASIPDSGSSGGAGGPVDLDGLFKKWGDHYDVDWRLLKAVAIHESSLNPNAVNAADPSYGLMQVLCRHGADGVCVNHFDVEGWDEATTEKLKDPDFNIMIGAQILAYNLQTFGSPKGIAVYNSWDQRNASPIGPFKNQSYVSAVLANYRNLGGSA